MNYFSNRTFKSAVMASTIVAGILSAPAAHAGGWLADTFLRPFSPQLADAADAANARAGNPVDHGAAAVLDAYVPGAGRALEAGWALQRSGVFNQPDRAPMPISTPAPRPVPSTYGAPSAPPSGWTPYGAPSAPPSGWTPFGQQGGGFQQARGWGSTPDVYPRRHAHRECGGYGEQDRWGGRREPMPAPYFVPFNPQRSR